MRFVHPLALTDETVSIGDGSKVWQFASVTRGTVIGRDCTVAPFALLDGAKLGDRVIFSMYACAGPGFVIGNDVFIGPSVVFANDAWPRAHKEGFDAEGLRSGEIVCVKVEDGASIGAGSVLLPGVTVGARAMVGAGCVVGKDVPADHRLTADGRCEPIRAEGRRMRAVR